MPFFLMFHKCFTILSIIIFAAYTFALKFESVRLHYWKKSTHLKLKMLKDDHYEGSEQAAWLLSFFFFLFGKL